MNAETLNVLNGITDAKGFVLDALTDSTVLPAEKKVLGKIFINLQEQEDTLINVTLQDMVDKINASNESLKDLIQQMKEASDKISKTSDTIKKISRVLSTVTKITGKVISSGLLG